MKKWIYQKWLSYTGQWIITFGIEVTCIAFGQNHLKFSQRRIDPWGPWQSKILQVGEQVEILLLSWILHTKTENLLLTSSARAEAVDTAWYSVLCCISQRLTTD